MQKIHSLLDENISISRIFYLDLRRRGHEIYYYLTKERYEVDFLSKDRKGKLHLYQVVWDNSEAETMEREVRSSIAYPPSLF